MKSVGHPILCDDLYASKNFLNKDSLGLKRLALHAHSLTIELPNNEEKTFTAPLPKELERAVTTLATL